MAALRSASKALRALADPGRGAVLQRFFKTGPGEYGEGDRFLGLTVPQVRALVREFHPMEFDAIPPLVASEWHEERLFGLLLLVARYERGDDGDRHEAYRLYLKSFPHVDNWDLVDTSAPYIVGAHLLTRSRAPLRRWARSKHLWTRRIAIVATQTFIRAHDFDDTLTIAELLMRDPHDLIHKATGWMLREVGKRQADVLRGFLAKHAVRMPRTMLRYAIERFPKPERLRWMSVR